MPKFNDFIKTFEEKETAPKVEEPKDKGTPQTPARTFKPLSKAEAEDMRKGGYTEDEYRYNQAKDYAIAMGEEMPDKRKFMQELGEWKEANKQKAEEALDKRFAEEDKAIKKYLAMGYDRDEAQQKANIDVNYGGDFDKNYEYGKDKEWNKAPTPKDNKEGQRIVNYGGKDMTFEEAKEAYKKAVAIPTLKRTPKQEAYLDKSAEYDIAQDELYKKWYEEKDPQKKAELKEQMDTLDKEYARFLDEWEEAERNRYKRIR